MYRLVKKILWSLDPEKSHRATIRLLSLAQNRTVNCCGLLNRIGGRPPLLPTQVMGLTFPSPLGLAAGFDKNGEAVDALQAMGFGFIELGTVTPCPQPGNPKPRLFRLLEARAVINRMGFNSLGLDQFLTNLKGHKREGVVAVNLGKNTDTPVEEALDDYCQGLEAVYSLADFVTLNISSPNTLNLRALQEHDALKSLLDGIGKRRDQLQESHNRRLPIAVKIAPDLDHSAIRDVAEEVVASGMDAIIATNTTVARPQVEGLPHAGETGGLSGKPLKPLALQTVRTLYQTLDGRLPIIGVGGIQSADDAWEFLKAGADLVQIYTGMLYQGPGLIGTITHELKRRVVKSDHDFLADLVAEARK